MEDYGHQNMSVLFFHISDNYATQETESRASYYVILGTPTTVFDGTERVVGGGTNMRPYYEPIILDHLGDNPYVSIDLSGSTMDETGGTLNVHIEALQYIPYGNCKVRYYVYQANIIGEDFMVRDVLDVDQLTIINAGETQDFVKDFVIDPGWYGVVNPEDIGVVAIVQSHNTKTVLNSADLSKVDVEITPESATVPMGTDLEITAHLTNITPWTQPIKAWLDVVLPNGNDLPSNPFMGPVSVNLPGGASIDYPLTVSIPDGIPTATYRLRLGVGNQDNSNDHWEYDYMALTVTE
jgi:hypothetical protein